MALRLAVLAALCLAASQAASIRGGVRGAQTPEVDPMNGKIPTAGEAVGGQTGVDVPNPHDYTGAIVGGGVAGTLVTLAIFCIATYMCYKWNSDMAEKGDEPYCGIMSCLCCCCCTPLVCCFPI